MGGHSREFKDVPEKKLHAPGRFDLLPPNHAENESHRIMRQGKNGGQGYRSTGSERGSRGRDTGEEALGILGQFPDGPKTDHFLQADFPVLFSSMSGLAIYHSSLRS